MGYLTNRTINYLNFHVALVALLEQAYGVFIPLYLYQQGFSVPEVFLLLGLFNAARLPLRLFSFPIAHRFGLRVALMIGAIGYSLSFPLLSMVEGYDAWLWLFTLVYGLFNALHWHCYHTFYSMAGEDEHRGKHISVAAGLSVTMAALAPILSAMFIAQTGFQKFFLLSIPLLVLMLLVLRQCENVAVARLPWREGKKLAFNLGAKIHVAESFVFFPLNIGWVFAVYFYVEKIVSLGAIVTFGIVVQVIYQLWIGKIIDGGRGRTVAHVAGALRTAETFLKALLSLSFLRIFAVEALKGAEQAHHNLLQPTVMYNAGKRAVDPFWYWLFAETAFDIGTILSCGGVALLLWWGVPLQLTILLALPGVLAVWWLTYRYFE